MTALSKRRDWRGQWGLTFFTAIVFFSSVAWSFNIAANKTAIFDTIAVESISFQDGSRLSTVALGTAKHPAQSCKEILETYHFARSGVYYLQDLLGNVKAGYCDMETDGGGWLLLTKMDSNRVKTPDIPVDYYNTVFREAQWIRGINLDPPLSPRAVAPLGTFSTHSHNWRAFLKPGAQYGFRTAISLVPSGVALDMGYTFTYPGFLLQDEQSVEEDRLWILNNMTYFEDTLGVAWEPYTDQTVFGFWPPFTPAVTGQVYTGCGCYQYGPLATTCNHVRVYGCAGVLRKYSLHDYGFVWSPHMLSYEITPQNDPFFLHQNNSVYGRVTSPTQMTMTYWLR